VSYPPCATAGGRRWELGPRDPILRVAAGLILTDFAPPAKTPFRKLSRSCPRRAVADWPRELAGGYDAMMRLGRRDIVWFIVAIALALGWFWLWAEAQRVITRTVREINGEILSARADKEELEERTPNYYS
jgi:hypothetical protein